MYSNIVAPACADKLLDHAPRQLQCGVDDSPNTSLNQLSESAAELHMNSVRNFCLRRDKLCEHGLL